MPTHTLRLKDGIIPARAGFTYARDVGGPAFGDHPRSRGVYPVKTGSGLPVAGSSPLARGLRRRMSRWRRRPGIIPARAGFTRGRRRGRASPWDHPRSRGVYAARKIASDVGRGSSPLARDLLIRTPALNRASLDHPRSRGVYDAVVGDGRVSGGSSPLARGLLDSVADVTEGARIIPARAGFTALLLLGADESMGSSPLARGLPVTKFREVSQGRIIPARAGFTKWAGM